MENHWGTGNKSQYGERPIDGRFYEIVNPDSPKQLFIANLASMLLPVATLYLHKEGLSSEEVQDHAGYLLKNEFLDNSIVEFLFMTIFGDADKPGGNPDRPNILGGVSFDLEFAQFRYLVPDHNKEYLLREMSDKKLQKLFEIVRNFRGNISGAEGLAFIEASKKHYMYNELEAIQIQKVLIHNALCTEEYVKEAIHRKNSNHPYEPEYPNFNKLRINEDLIR